MSWSFIVYIIGVPYSQCDVSRAGIKHVCSIQLTCSFGLQILHLATRINHSCVRQVEYHTRTLSTAKTDVCKSYFRYRDSWRWGQSPNTPIIAHCHCQTCCQVRLSTAVCEYSSETVKICYTFSHTRVLLQVRICHTSPAKAICCCQQVCQTVIWVKPSTSTVFYCQDG